MADQTVTLRIKSDATGVVASVDLVKSKMGDLGNTSQQAGQRAAAGLSMARRGVESISAQLRNLQNLASVWAAFAGVRAVVRDLVSTADAMTSLNARLRIATGSTEAYAQAQQTVQAVAISARSDLESVATLYTRLAQSSQSLGISQQELGEITEAVSMAVTLSGGSAASAAAGVQQLAQAFASGVLSGDEFRSVMENSPRVVKALTDTLGVSVGELRKLAEQQKLTADIVADSLRLQLTAMQAEMTKMPQTVGQALGQVSNAWSLYVNNVNQAAGVTGSLAQVLDGITTLLMAEANASHESAGGLEFLAAGLQIVTIAGVAFKNVVEVMVNGVAMLADIVGTVTSTIGTLLANSIQSLQEYQSAILRLDFEGAWRAVADGNARNMAAIQSAGQQIAIAYETAQAGVESAHNDIAKSWAALTEVQARAVKLTGEQMATLGAAFSGGNGEGGVLGGIKAFGTALYDMAKGPQDEIDELRKRVAAMFGSVETGADGAAKKIENLYTHTTNLTDATGDVDNMLRDMAYGLANDTTRALMDYEDVQARILNLEMQWLDLGPMSEAQIAKLAELRKLAAEGYAKQLGDINAETVREAEWAAQESARAWEDFTYDLASAIADGASGVKRWWRAMLDDMKRQLIQSGLLKLMQALFGNKASGLSLAGSSGPGFGSILSSLFGGGGAGSAGGTSMFGQLFSAKSWAAAGKSLWAGLFGAASTSSLGTAGYGVLTGLGGSAQIGSGAFAAYLGPGSTATYGVSLGGTGYGTGAGGASSAGGMGAGALGGWIAAAVIANLLSWQHGYRPDGGTVQTPWGSTVHGEGMGSGGWDFAGKIITKFATGLLSKLGLSDKWASVLGGSSLVTRVFGHRAPEITGSGAQYSFGPGGISGDQWANIYQKGGWLRSSKRWTERGALDAETIKNIEAFWQAIVDANAETARVLGLESAASVAASWKQAFDRDGKLTSEAGTILGRTYAESWEVFTQRIAAENIIANIDAALGTQVQAVGEATVGAMIAGANARIAHINGPIDYRDPEPGPGYGGGGGIGVPNVPQAMGEASAIAERWRHDAELLAQGAQFLLLAATDIQHGVGLLGEGGTLTQITNLVEELAVGGETLTDTYARVATSTALLDQALDMSGVQIDGTREHIVRLATAITDAAGGLDRAEALWGAYFDRFYSETERAQYALTQATTSAESEFADIGKSLGDFTGEGGIAAFRALFESVLPTLSAEAVVDWLEAAAALGIVLDATDALNATLDNATTAIAQTAEQLATIQGILDENAWNLAAAGMTEVERAVAQINRAYDEQRDTLIENAATVQQLATLEEQRTAALAAASAQVQAQISDLLGGLQWDAALDGMSDAERQLAEFGRQWDGYEAQLIALGASTAQLTELESLRAQALAQLTASQEAATAAEQARIEQERAAQMASIDAALADNAWQLYLDGLTDSQRAIAELTRYYDDLSATLTANGATAEQLATAEEQRAAAMQQLQEQFQAQNSDLLTGNNWTLLAASMTEAQRAVIELERSYDAMREQMVANGATAEQLGLLESQRAMALQQLHESLMRQNSDLLAENAWKLLTAGMSESQRAAMELARSYDVMREQLIANGATADQLAALEAQRAEAMQQLQDQLQGQIADLLGGLQWDAALAGMTEFERQLAELGRQWDEYRNQLAGLGANAEQLALLESLRADAMARLLATQAEQAAAEQAEAEAALAQGSASYREFLQGILRETQTLTAYQEAMRDASDWQASAIATANEHARAAGMAGASEQALALIERRAAQLRAAALAQLREETQSLIEQLYGSGGDSIGEAFTSGMQEAGDAAANYWEQQRQAAETLQQYLDSMLLGDLSALSPAEQLQEAWSQLNAAVAGGDAQQATQLADVYLRMLREMEASGEDYNQGFWSVRELLQGMLDGIGPIGDAPTDGAGSGGYITAADAEQIAAQNRLDLAVQLAQHLADLSSAVGQTVYDLMESMGVDLHELTADLGINLQTITGETVLALVNMADLLGSNLLDLTGQLGVSLTAMGAGIRELAEQTGVNLDALTAESAMALGNLANQLGIDLADIATSVGQDLGGLADAQSLLNQALAAQIDALPDGTGDAVAPYLEAIQSATTEADASAAIDAMAGYINTLAPDIRNALAPYFADVFPADALNDLDYLSAISTAADAQVDAVHATNAILASIATQLGVPQVPSYAVGTSYVPQDGMAMIHQGEAIIPAPFAAWMRENGIPVSGGAGASPEMLAELRAIRARLDSIERSDARNAERISATVAKTGETSDRNNDQSRARNAQAAQRRGVTA